MFGVLMRVIGLFVYIKREVIGEKTLLYLMSNGNVFIVIKWDVFITEISDRDCYLTITCCVKA